MTKDKYMRGLILYVSSIRGHIDAIAWAMHYALLVYGIFTLAYFLFQENYKVIPIVLTLLIMTVYSLANEHRLANANAKVMFFMNMADEYCAKLMEERSDVKA